MTTRLYFRSAVSPITGTLPSTEQSTRTAYSSMDSQSNNKIMITTKGTAQTSISDDLDVIASLRNFYISKWVSQHLDETITSIDAETWTLNFALYNPGDVPGNFVGLPYQVFICLYVWRPSTGAKVGNIFDAAVSSGTIHYNKDSQVSYHKTFAGSSVSDVEQNDVIIAEIWLSGYTTGDTGAYTWNFYYDGGVETTTDNTDSLTNHASFVETPQDLSFFSPPALIEMTNAWTKSLNSKFITSV